MRHRTYKSITFVLALLLALSSWMPMPIRADAQMRCVGASPRSAPCARIMLPAAGLTEAQVYRKLMPCCRAMRVSAMRVSAMRVSAMRVSAMQSCSMPHSLAHSSRQGIEAHLASLSCRRCFVTIHVAAVGATAPAVSRARWFLTANPALAPPVTVQSAFAPALLLRPAFWTYSPTLSTHAQPHLHGLRAPPAA
jgi:hypothetical protein